MSVLDALRQDDEDGHPATVAYNEALDDVRDRLLTQLACWQPPAHADREYWAGYSKALADVRRWAGGDGNPNALGNR